MKTRSVEQLCGPFAFAVYSALTISIAFLIAGGPLTAAAGWVSVLCLVSCVRKAPQRYLPLFVSGVIAHAIGFYWMVHTISFFGKFPLFAALCIFFLFICANSLTYLLVLFLYHRLPRTFHQLGIGFACTWACVELLPVRIFPWSFAHTQIGFPWIAQLADLAGTPLITFLMFWVCECALAWRYVRYFAIAPLVALVAALQYGGASVAFYDSLQAPTQEVMVVQANISIEDKHDIMAFAKNSDRYVRLTEQNLKPNQLVVWPETVIQDWIPDTVTDVTQSKFLPRFSQPISFLTGALTYIPPADEIGERFFNSAVAILEDQSVPAPYHKQVLMPFGEYVPFGSIFPWLKETIGMLSDFTPGEEVTAFVYRRLNPDLPEIKLSAVVCYEDLIPSLTRQAAEGGATLLANLTNDAWFGDTRAPFEHHMIASFRAIETRRYFIRSTNSGLTAIVDPIGRTTGSLAPFSEGILNSSVRLISERSPFTIIGHSPWWALAFVLAVFCCVQTFLDMHRRNRSSSGKPPF